MSVFVDSETSLSYPKDLKDKDCQIDPASSPKPRETGRKENWNIFGSPIDKVEIWRGSAIDAK
jgi:hypothetical protein